MPTAERDPLLDDRILLVERPQQFQRAGHGFDVLLDELPRRNPILARQ
jgi:hypothetical protein